MSGIPSITEIPDLVKTILAFMDDIEVAEKVVAAMQASNKNNIRVDVKGDPTNQGRYALQIEGNM